MDINYDYYRIFYYVARYKSISKASEVLYRGQPNITKVISNLEKQLNTILFVRSSRGVTLTLEGEKLYSHIEIAFNHIFLGEEELNKEHNLETGRLRIATTETALYGLALDSIKRFTQDFPKVRINLSNSNNDQAYNAIINGISDIAIVTKKEKKNELIGVRTLKTFKDILCCKKGYIFSVNEGDIDILKTHPLISLSKNTYSYGFYNDYLTLRGVNKEPEIEVATIDQVALLIKHGLGIGFLPDTIAKPLIEEGILDEIQLSKLTESREICLIYNKKQPLSVVAKKFIEYL